MVLVLRNILLAGTIAYAAYLFYDIYQHKEELKGREGWLPLGVMTFVFTFLDCIGIGNFATSTSGFKFTKTVSDEKIPGTLNVAYCVSTAVEAILFLSASRIDPLTCVSMIAAAVVGAYFGARIVCRMSLKAVRYGMGFAMTALAIVMACRNLGVGPFGAVGTALGVRGFTLVIAIAVNFFLGALMMIGVGLYAPCMALVGLLGMNIQMAFPIMMGSCGFLMISGGAKFIKEGKYDRKAAFSGTIFGTLGGVVAFLFVTSISISRLLWIVIAVMAITAVMFFRDGKKTVSGAAEAVKEEKKDAAVGTASVNA